VFDRNVEDALFFLVTLISTKGDLFSF